MAKVLFITINCRCATATVDFLQSLQRVKGFFEIDVIVVDNASGDGSSLRIGQATHGLSNVELLQSVENRGYFGGANWALAHFQETRRVLPDWVIVCNNDVLIYDEGFLKKLLAQDPDSAGVLAPRIESLATQLDQNPFLEERPDRRALQRLWFWGRSYPLALFQHAAAPRIRRIRALTKRFNGHRATGNQQARKIYAPHGAFLIFSRQYFRLGGFLDDGYFLYGEEVSVAEICRRLHLEVRFEPALHVLHNEHQSVGSGLTRAKYSSQRKAREYLRARYLGDIA